MSKETAKKNWRNNVRRMNAFTFITCVVTALYVLVIMFRNGGLPGPWDIVCLSFWAGQEFAALAALKAFAKPSFGADGALVECADVSNPAELGYYTFAQDVLWISWVVQTLCNVHHAFFVFYLPVPATVIYKVWTSFLGPLLMGSSGSAAAEQGGSETSPRNRQERRQQELKQRKAARRAGERG